MNELLPKNEPNLIYKTNLKKRFWASFLDYLIIITLDILYIEQFGNENNEGGKTVEGLLVLPLILLWFVYFVLIETIFTGTLGHLAFNLNVVSLNRKKISFLQALKRHLMDPIEFFIWGIPAFISINNTDKKQRLGDLMAKTIVIDSNDPDQNPEFKKAYNSQFAKIGAEI
jgi:uncharacterized RDD family membrane protein YckC